MTRNGKIALGCGGGGCLGMILLVVLVAAPCRAHDRAVGAYRTAAAIRLPDPERISTGAVVSVRRSVERVERFDLARDLPAPASA